MNSEIFLDGKVKLHCGDSREVLKTIADHSIDSIVTDPPYALVSITKRFGKPGSAPVRVGNINASNDLKAAYGRTAAGFMGKQWDTGETVESVEFWTECLRVLKPGGHIVAFSGTRTYHRMACAIEDAGFEIRDCLQWIYGSGFPKSHDVSKGIDRAKDWSLIERLSEEIKRARGESGLSLKEIGAATLSATGGQYGAWYHRGGHMFFETGRALPSRPEWDQLRHVLPIKEEFVGVYDAAEREVIGENKNVLRSHRSTSINYSVNSGSADITAPSTAAAIEWQGWGTALKPAWESIALAQKPYDLEGFCGILARKLMEAVCQLSSSAKAADETSPLSPSESEEAFGSVQWDAVAECNTPDDLFALMDMWPSELELPLSLSTASSWLGILAGLLRHGSTFTTETRTSLTTDLKTLNSLLSQNTPDITDLAATLQSGTASSASLVAGIFNAVAVRLRLTLELSALDPATLKDGFSDIRPNCEPICFGRKPLIGTVADNVLKHGTGAINVDGCRVSGEIGPDRALGKPRRNDNDIYGTANTTINPQSPFGRWPANIIHDGSEEVIAAFPVTQTNANTRDGLYDGTSETTYGKYSPRPAKGQETDSGSAARFFYTSKADADDRLGSSHPTVKPVDLMQWLVRLVTPKGGTCLDPFAGTGTTAEAAFREGMQCVLIEREAEYQDDIRRRMALVLAGPDERARESIKAKLKDKAVDHGPLFEGMDL